MTEYRDNEPVRYWPGWRDGNGKIGRLRSAIVTKVGGTDCLYIRGEGAVALAHIEPMNFTDTTIEVRTVAEAMIACEWEFTDVVITDNDERIKMQKMLKGFR
jgi:hypothetical protein